MYVKVHNPKESGGNTGSSEALFSYLEKENEGRDIVEHEHFFSHHQEGFSKYEAMNIIDNNKAKLGKEDEKFFMVSINPSEPELKHIQEKYGVDKTEEALKHYTRNVMDEYAKNFNRSIIEDTGEKYNKDNPEHRVLIEHNEKLAVQEKELKSSIDKYKQTTNSEIKDLRTELRDLKKAEIEPTLVAKAKHKLEINKLDKQLKSKLDSWKSTLDSHKKEIKELQANYKMSDDGHKIKHDLKIKEAVRQMNGSDLVYFAKIEKSRSYDPKDERYIDTYKQNEKIQKKVRGLKSARLQSDDFNKMTQITNKINQLEKQYVRNDNNTPILPHNLRDGANHHVHVVVSRKDMSGRLKLHPLTNSKGSKNNLNGKIVDIGFNRDKFKERSEKAFDSTFKYDRPVYEKYSFMRDMVKNPEKAMVQLIHAPKNPKELAKRMVKEVMKDNEVFKTMNKIPKNKHQLVNKIVDKSIDAIAKAVSANPVGLTVTVAKKIVKSIANQSIQELTRPHER